MLAVRVPPVVALLTSLGRVKAELGIAGTATDTTDNDDLLFDIIRRASEAIARECGRPHGFGVATFTETLRGTNSQLLAVAQTPILSIASVYQDDELLTPLDPTDPASATLEGYYVEDADAGAIYRAGGWGRTTALLSWGYEAYASRYIIPGGADALRYTVTYTAGYLLPAQQLYALQAPITGIDALYDPTFRGGAVPVADPPQLPGYVEQACLEQTKWWWLTKDRDYSILAAQVDNVRVQFSPRPAQQTALTPECLGNLRNARRVVA